MPDITLAEAQALVANLKRAIMTGQRIVAYEDKTVTFRTMEEMQQALRFAEGEVEALGGAAVTGSRQIVAVTEDGW